jgi:Zn-dependent protease
VLILDLIHNPSEFLALIAALVLGLSVHECAHAWVANRLGDPTAANRGRLTLDPRRHIEPLGALVFLVAGFGWARPVPVDGYRLGRGGMLRVALAGPGSNLLLGAVAGLVVRVGLTSGWAAGAVPRVFLFLDFFTFLNLSLAVFNLLPLAPLDGWNVLMGLVPAEVAQRLEHSQRYGMLVLLALLVVGRIGNTSILGAVIGAPVDWLTRLLLGSG